MKYRLVEISDETFRTQCRVLWWWEFGFSTFPADKLTEAKALIDALNASKIKKTVVRVVHP